jgi:hypothetical protein
VDVNFGQLAIFGVLKVHYHFKIVDVICEASGRDVSMVLNHN